MSDEEKKAIENLKTEYEKLIKEDNILFPLYKSEAKRLINVIEKQSKEIEKLKENKGYHLGFIDGEISKKYEYQDKIKAKIEEVDYKMIAHQDIREAVKQVLNSLLEKE